VRFVVTLKLICAGERQAGRARPLSPSCNQTRGGGGGSAGGGAQAAAALQTAALPGSPSHLLLVEAADDELDHLALGGGDLRQGGGGASLVLGTGAESASSSRTIMYCHNWPGPGLGLAWHPLAHWAPATASRARPQLPPHTPHATPHTPQQWPEWGLAVF
jgi:hypothetical protein